MTRSSTPQPAGAPATTGPNASAVPSPHLLVVASGLALLLASELVAPRMPDGLSAKESAALVIGHADRFLWSYLLGLLAAAGLVALFLLVGTTVRGRGAGLARVSTVLGTLGGIGLAGHMSGALLARDLLLADAGTAGVVNEAAYSGVSTIATLLPLVVGLDLGFVLLVGALVRAGRLPAWAVAAAVLALVADFSPTSWNTVLFSAIALSLVVLYVVRSRRTPAHPGGARVPGLGSEPAASASQ